MKVDEVSKQLKEERLKTLELETQIQSRALDQRHTHEVDHTDTHTQLFTILQKYTEMQQCISGMLELNVTVKVKKNKLPSKYYTFFPNTFHYPQLQEQIQDLEKERDLLKENCDKFMKR